MKVEKDIPGLCSEKTPAGNPRWRVRVEGDKDKKITIPVGPSHLDFDEHYSAAREGRKFVEKKTIRPGKGSLDEMSERFIEWMRNHIKAGNRRQSTLESRVTGLNHARKCRSQNNKFRIGQMNADLPREAFTHIRDSFGSQTGAAHSCLKALRALYTWGVDYGYPSNSPVFGVRSHHVEKGGAKPWADEDAEKFLARHGPGTMARRWFLLAEATAGRIGDMHTLGPRFERTKGERLFIRYQPSKRGSAEVELPLPWGFMLEVAELLPDAPAYLLTHKTTPFESANSLDNTVRRWIIEAGLCLPVLDEDGKQVIDGKGKPKFQATHSQHGIRKRRAVKIAEASGSIFEVMAHLSHKDPKTAAIYTQRVDRARLAEQAAIRAEGHAKTQGVPPGFVRGALRDAKSKKERENEASWQPVGESNPSFQVENLAS